MQDGAGIAAGKGPGRDGGRKNEGWIDAYEETLLNIKENVGKENEGMMIEREEG